ncbi:hypothetical protein LCGC14_0792320 [marine sediment metagenome]|uniref:Uncharacterized protein n=1 Tax=marine sediment metagenome TaxID=412755 RepID=A0A0F9QC17_9ZZZZ
MSPLLNYTTSVPAMRTIGQVQGKLAEHGAKAIMMNYEQGRVVSLAFQVDGPAGLLSIKLPTDLKAVLKVMVREGLQPRYLTEDHAYRVAWRIVKDWLEAQMALLDTEMVKMEQIFLPYVMTKDGKTVYEVMARMNFQLPEGRD